MVAGSVTSAAVAGAVAWDVVVGHRFIAAMAAPAPDASMSALAEATSHAQLSIESLVGMMAPVGRGGGDSFAVVYWPTDDPSAVTVVVRGHAVVDLSSPGGTRRFDARDIRPWHLADFDAVIALRVTAADAPLDRLGEAPHALGHACASLRASTVEWAIASPATRTEEAVPDADTVLMSRRRSARQHAADDGGDPERLEPAVADTVLTPRRHPGRRALDPMPAPPLAPDPTTAVEDAPSAPVPEPEPGPKPDSEPSRETLVPRAVPRNAPWFRLGDGPARRVSAPVLVGRRPLGPRVPGVAGAVPELVAVPSPGQIVSATHLELRLEGTRLVATDLRSTNGTVVRNASGSRRLRAGESVVVVPGTSLDLGDDTIIEIVSAPAASPD